MVQEKIEYVIKTRDKKGNDVFLGEPNMIEDYPMVTQLNFANKFVDSTIAVIFLSAQKELLDKGFEVLAIKVIYEY